MVIVSYIFRRIRERWGEIPVFVLTGYPEGERVKEARRNTSVVVLSKNLEVR